MASDVWVTQDGREIPVEKMTDAHVVHSLRFFQAKAVALAVGDDDTRKGTLGHLKMKSISKRVSMMEREVTRRGLNV